jgi:tRNA (guanine26-N2/guanine27-N2)-dimethyltransferase
MHDNLQEITEGITKLLVPSDSITEKVPPKSPAFFNPNAKLNRDLSMIAYRAFVGMGNNRNMADALAGVGARSVRAAVEVEELDEVYINDANPIAIDMARQSSALNRVENKCRFSVNGVCKFLIEHSAKGSRFDIVDLDPFGTPAPYIDCALRAVCAEGLLSITATDTPVLCGIYPDVCMRRYHGRSINTEYGNEVGLRLLLGLISMVASRLELGIKPLFVHSTRNYLRVYLFVSVGSKYADAMPSKMGYIHHCFSCNNRTYSNMPESQRICDKCKKPMKPAGQLWVDTIFDHAFVDGMIQVVDKCTVDKRCGKLLSIVREEVNSSPTYFSVDRIAERLKITPPRISNIIERLKDSGFIASRTSLKMTGFKTNAKYDQVLEVLRAIVA